MFFSDPQLKLIKPEGENINIADVIGENFGMNNLILSKCVFGKIFETRRMKYEFSRKFVNIIFYIFSEFRRRIKNQCLNGNFFRENINFHGVFSHLNL